MPSYPHRVEVWQSGLNFSGAVKRGESDCLVIPYQSQRLIQYPILLEDLTAQLFLQAQTWQQQWSILLPLTGLSLFTEYDRDSPSSSRYIYPVVGMFNPFHINIIPAAMVEFIYQAGPVVVEFTVYSTHIRLLARLDTANLFDND